MNYETLTAKLLDLAEGRETPKSWWGWWNDHESEIEFLLNRGEFLKLKPHRHGFSWVPVLGSQKGAVAILKGKACRLSPVTFTRNDIWRNWTRTVRNNTRSRVERQKEFKTKHPEWFDRYPKFSNTLAKVLSSSDKLQAAATIEQIQNQEKMLGFTLPAKVREFSC